MGLENILTPKFIWPDINEIRKKHYLGEILTSEDVLALKSRSFYAPIKLLSVAKGKEEVDKERYIMAVYNILRELDEIEDAFGGRLNPAEKKEVIGRFTNVIRSIVKKNGGGIEGIIAGDDFRTVTRKLMEGAAGEDARIFAEQFGKGGVLREFYEFGKEENGKKIQKAIEYSVLSMAGGMNNFLTKGSIQDIQQLIDYCNDVAGRIGSLFLNELVEIKDKVSLGDQSAERFGEYLQLTNIIKNIREDYLAGRRFLPEQSRHGEASYEYMMDGDGEIPIKARGRMFEKMLILAKSRFSGSIGYVKSIPEKLSGYRAFCFVPLISAQKTLEKMEMAEAEKVFRGDEKSIKVSFDVINNIANFSKDFVRLEENYVNEWLDYYKENPSRFPFSQGEYEKWAYNWLSCRPHGVYGGQE